MFDTHAHLNFKDFKDDLPEVLQRIKEKKMTVINVGSQISTSHRAVELAQNNEKMFASVGLHPIHLQEIDVQEEHATFKTRKEEFAYETYRELGNQLGVVAIGETGLDFHHVYDESKREEIIEEQKQVFNKHIDLANDLDLPMIIHCRGTKEDIEIAYHDLLYELKRNMPKQRGVLHCYVGPVELVDEFAKLGFYFGFNGVSTFDKTGKLEKIALKVPKDKILIETDCPYLTPPPYRGKRNEPVYVEYILNKIAEIRGMSFETLEQISDQNARKLFKISL